MKPKYPDKLEFMLEFNAVLAGLDKANPKDPTQLPKQVKPTNRALSESVKVVKVVVKPEVKAESAWMSRYSTPARAMDSFRLLAGLDVVETMPWNPGIVGETRTPRAIMEDANVSEDMDQGNPVAQSAGMHRQSAPSMGGWSAKRAHKALTRSARVISASHAHHSYMNELEPHEKNHIKGKLAAAHKAAADELFASSDGAHPDVHRELSDLGHRHMRHHKIYMSGGRPKLESMERMNAMVEALKIPIENDLEPSWFLNQD